MTIKNEKYLPRLKKKLPKKAKNSNWKKYLTQKKIMETLKSTSVVRRSKWLSKKEKNQTMKKKWMIKKESLRNEYK